MAKKKQTAKRARGKKAAKPEIVPSAGARPGKTRTVVFSGSESGREKIEAMAAKAGLKVRTPAQIEAEKRAAAAPATKANKKPVRKREGLSGLDAAAKVLSDAKGPLGAKDMVERMIQGKLWATKGATPEATIYAAIIREIAKKGKDSRFKKAERGRFTITAAGKKG